MQKLIYCFVLLLAAGVNKDVRAQTFHVSGFTKDNTGAPIQAVNVLLLKASDSSWVQSELTDDKGAFSFKDVSKGNYLVSVQAVGYDKQMHSITVSKDMDAIAVTASRNSTQLKEVTVSSNKPYIEKGLGKITVNVDQAATSAGSSVLDLLRKSPGVTVDGNGGVSLQGNGALIMIDDKQTYMAGDQLKDYLKSLPAEQVAQLELVTQPSSKYDAEGAAGIINIKLKKLKRKGMNGSATVAYGQSKYPNTHDNLNLNYRNNKVNVYTTASYLHATGYLNQHTERTYTPPTANAAVSHNDQTSFLKETFEDYNLKLGADYTVSDKVTTGVSVNGFYHPNNETDKTRSVVTDIETNTVTYNNANTVQSFVRNNAAGNAYVKYSPAKGHDINVNVDYLTRAENVHQDITSRNYNAQLNPASGDVDLQSYRPNAINVWVGNADYTGEFKNDLKLEAGLKHSYTQIDDDAVYKILQNNTYVVDTIRSSHFIYKENISAAYMNVAKQFGKKWQAQAGLRVEHTNSQGNQRVRNQAFEKDYTGLFPAAYVGYTLNDKHSFQCSFGRRIIRPGYKELDPFINYMSQYSYSGGNPNLLPAYRNYLELSHNYNNELFSSIGVRKIGNTVNPISIYNPATLAVFNTSINNADRWVLELSSSYNKQLFSWWLMSSSVEVYYNEYTPHKGKGTLATSLAADFGFNNTFTIHGDWTIDTFAHIGTAGLQNLTEVNGTNKYIGFSVGKKLMKDTATIKLSVEDPFDTYRYTLTKNWNGVSTHSVMGYATQSATLGFTYNFGKKFDDARQRNHNVEESGRM